MLVPTRPWEYMKPVAVADPPRRVFPLTDNVYAGVVVPIPTLPRSVIMN